MIIDLSARRIWLTTKQLCDHFIQRGHSTWVISKIRNHETIKIQVGREIWTYRSDEDIWVRSRG